MSTTSTSRLISSLRAFSHYAGVGAALVGVLVLIGGALDIEILKTLTPGTVTMKANAALAFVLGGVSLALFNAGEAHRRWRFLAQGCAAFVALLGAATLWQYLVGPDLGIDELLFREADGAFATFTPGRMATATALNFLLLGFSLWLLHARRFVRLMQCTSLAIALIGLLALIGRLYGVELLQAAPYTTVALHAAATFLLLAVGMLCARADAGPMAVVTSDSAGGDTARRLLVPAFCVPFLLGWLVLASQRTGLHDAAFGLALLTILNIVVLLVLIWTHSLLLHQAEIQRKAAAEAVVHSEKRYRSLVTATTSIVWTADSKGDFVFGQPSWEAFTRQAWAEHAGAGWMEAVHPDDRPEMLRTWSAAVRNRTDYDHEMRLRRYDGQYRHVAARAVPVLDAEGTVREWVGTCRDITDRKRAQAALVASEAKYQDLYELAPDMFVTADATSGEILGCNETLATELGFEKEELIGRSLFDFYHPSCLDQAHRVFNQFRYLGTVRDEELQLRRRSGAAMDVSLNVSAVRDERQKIVRGRLVFRDISDRKMNDQVVKEHAEELRRTNERVETFLENALDAHVSIDETGAITDWSRKAAELFGWSRSEALRQQLADLVIPPQHQLAHRQGLARFLETGEGPVLNKRIEITAMHKDGREFPIELSITPIRLGTSWCFDAFVRDITDRRMVNEVLAFRARELAETNNQLMQSNQELDEFAYVASHDLREPLRGIHNYSTFLLEDYGPRLDDEAREKLATLQRLSQRMDALIEALLQFSRVGRVDLAMRETNLNEVVAEAVNSLRFSLLEKGVEVQPSPLPTVACDKVRVGEVFANLISNAIKYNDKPEKWIKIGVALKPKPPDPAQPANGQPAQAAPVFFVRDNGIGIAEKHQESIFRIFKRLHARDKFGGGAGAGLTIVKKIVERHGGRIWLESTPGEGSVFFFTLQNEN